MGTLERFTEFHQSLAPEKRKEVETMLERIMLRDRLPELSDDQITELQRRLADTDTVYIPAEDVMDEARARIDNMRRNG